MLREVFKNPWLQAVGVLGALVLFGLFCYLLSPVLIPLFFAFFVAYMLNPVVDFLERRHIGRGITISVVAFAAILLVLAIPLLLIPNLIGQSEKLITAAAAKAGNGTVATRVNYLINQLPLDEMIRYLDWVPEDAPPIEDPLGIIAAHIGTYVKDNALQLLRSYGPNVASAGHTAGSAAAQIVAKVSRGTVELLLFLAHFALFAFVAVYLLRDFHKLVRYAEDLVPPRYRAHLFDILGKINFQLRGFLRGQLLVCLCMGILYATGLFISGTPFGIIIGLFGGVASFVPYLGITLTILPSIILTILQHGIDWHVLAVLITFGVAHATEGYFLTPKIVGEHVGLNPVWVILAILVFTSLLGFVGLLIAVPTAAVLKVLVVEALNYYRKSALFSSDPE